MSTSQSPYHTADILTSQSPCYGADVSTSRPLYNADSILTSQTPFLTFATSEPTVCRADSEHAHMPVHSFPREQPQSSHLGSHHVHTHTLPRRPVTAVSDSLHAIPREMPQLTSALPRQLDTRATVTTDPVPAHMPVRAFSRSPQPACTQSTQSMTSMLPGQPAEMPLGTTTRVRPLARHDVLISALPRPLSVPGDLPSVDYIMQRVADRVDNRSNVYTLSDEQWLPQLTHLPPPPPVHRQPTVPLLSDIIQTTATAYVNQDPVPVLTAHRYANTPFDSNYQNIFALSLPAVSTHTNVPTYVGAPLSYTEDSQRVPIAVEQAGFSAFSCMDVHDSRPAVADSGKHYTICTPASADGVRPTVIAHPPPLPSPSVHWRKRFAYDYIQPDTGLGASTHAAPAIHSGYIRPQISDTHTHTHIHPVCTYNTYHLEKVL